MLLRRLTDHVDETTHVYLRKNDMELRGSIIIVRVFYFTFFCEGGGYTVSPNYSLTMCVAALRSVFVSVMVVVVIVAQKKGGRYLSFAAVIRRK